MRNGDEPLITDSQITAIRSFNSIPHVFRLVSQEIVYVSCEYVPTNSQNSASLTTVLRNATDQSSSSASQRRTRHKLCFRHIFAHYFICIEYRSDKYRSPFRKTQCAVQCPSRTNSCKILHSRQINKKSVIQCLTRVG